MKKKTKNLYDSDMPVGKLVRDRVFLPSPEELFPKEEVRRITLVVDNSTVEFFRKKARKIGVKYQPMMRRVLREYALKFVVNG